MSEEKSRPGEKAAIPKVTVATKQNIPRPPDSYVQETLTGIIDSASEWDKSLFRTAIQFRAEQPGSFMIEEIIETTGLPVDRPNLVGALTRSAAEAGLIRRVGYAKARRASRAGGVSAVWVGARWYGASEVVS